MIKVEDFDIAATMHLNLDGVNLIEASAGTGKTYTIANLYLWQLISGYTPPQILTVSFTNAATDELSERIHARARIASQAFEHGIDSHDTFIQALLEQYRMQDQAQQTVWRERLRHALRSMDEAAISTIHGFCQQALRDHALLCGQPFEGSVIPSDDVYWDRALKDWWRRHCYPMTSDQWSVFQQAVPGLKSLLGWQREIRRQRTVQIVPATDTTLMNLLESCPAQDSDEWPQALDRIRARTLIEAYAEAEAQVAREKQRSGEMAYSDQLALLLQALEGAQGKTLAQQLRARFPVAMIDEFQDTDETQFRIFEHLYFDVVDTRLILIGDPKQAIYSFRGSDIFTYMRARHAPGVRIHALRTNWRSTPGLIDAVNQLFCARAAPFIYAEDIRFDPAVAPPHAVSSDLELDGTAAPALTIWRLPQQSNNKPSH